MDLNLELMREQIALHRFTTANSSCSRNQFRSDARAIRHRIEGFRATRGLLGGVKA